MNLRSLIESRYNTQIEDFTASRPFVLLENGKAARSAYDAFIANVCRTHLKSPQIVAFLFSVAPPDAAENMKQNLLEELGLDKGGVSHPALLLELAAAADFDYSVQVELELAAEEELRGMIAKPILFATLKEVGLSVLVETVAFEWMLSRTAARIGGFLSEHRPFSTRDLRWFHHHSEVDVRHAEEGLQAVVDYAEYYEFDLNDVEVILDVTFRENVFVKRYFREIKLAKQAGSTS